MGNTIRKRLRLVGVGPQRTATSWLDRALRHQGQLAFPEHVKETFFFDRNFSRGWSWYESLFQSSSKKHPCAEIGSTYFESVEAMERIRSSNGETKILISVRNPIERSFSSFVHEYSKGRVSDDFFEALKQSPRIAESGSYAEIAPRWEKSFGRESVLYVLQDNIADNPQRVVDDICDFADLDHFVLPEAMSGRFGERTVPRISWLAGLASRTASGLRHTGLHKLVEAGKRVGLKRVYGGGDSRLAEMSEAAFHHLLQRHSADIDFLERRLNCDFSAWRTSDKYE